jgi:hypothetical protein
VKAIDNKVKKKNSARCLESAPGKKKKNIVHGETQ